MINGTKKRDGRGGARPGSGRKPNTAMRKPAVSIYLTHDTLAELDKMRIDTGKSRSEIVEGLILSKKTY